MNNKPTGTQSQTGDAINRRTYCSPQITTLTDQEILELMGPAIALNSDCDIWGDPTCSDLWNS